MLNELFDLLRIPSISADPAYNNQVALCAEHIAAHMTDLGIQNVNIYPTQGHPIVYGDFLVDPALPTVLVYGHYDVQPADPIELWDNDPFDPIIKTND